MEDGSDLDADDRALAVHEAGHAVVARGLGAEVVCVEINLQTGDGRSRSSVFADNVKTLAVLVAGHKAELAFAARELNLSKMLAAHAVRSTRDYQEIQELLLRLPEVERLAALVEGFSLADEKLNAKADVVHKIADELLARQRTSADTVIRIEGEDLIALLGR